jgi:UDP-N-acetylglucosamine pyrophosphorylase
MAFLTQNKAKLFKNLIITLVFEKNAIFSPKIAENCDHKINPRFGEFSPLKRLNTLDSFLKVT